MICPNKSFHDKDYEITFVNNIYMCGCGCEFEWADLHYNIKKNGTNRFTLHIHKLEKRMCIVWAIYLSFIAFLGTFGLILWYILFMAK